MSLEETFTNLSAFLNSLDAEGEQKFELSHSLVIICPDCGKNIAFRGRCPKCGGNSWIPAGHAGGIFERVKAQRWRQMLSDDDDTAGMRSMRPGTADVDDDIEAAAMQASQPEDSTDESRASRPITRDEDDETPQ
jgi:hypothetical protein